MITGNFEIINVDRRNSLPGAGPFDFDFCIVYSVTETEPNALTGKPQAKRLFSGELRACHSWVAANSTGA